MKSSPFEDRGVIVVGIYILKMDIHCTCNIM